MAAQAAGRYSAVDPNPLKKDPGSRLKTFSSQLRENWTDASPVGARVAALIESWGDDELSTPELAETLWAELANDHEGMMRISRFDFEVALQAPVQHGTF